MSRLRHSSRGIPGALALAFLLAISGCTKSNDNPVGALSGTGSQVHLAMSFTNGASGVSLMKTAGTAEADSIRIDSLVVVVEKIHLQSAGDSLAMEHGDDHGEDGTHGQGDIGFADDSGSVTLVGPFIIHVRDTLSVDFASQQIPAGTYGNISFIIHRLHQGDEGFDSDDQRETIVTSADSNLAGSSVVIWGAVLKNGTWVPFRFNADIELRVNIPGTFVVPQSLSSVTLAFNFNVGMLFRDPTTGLYLDPTDTSMFNHQRIDFAIEHAFGSGHCGNDDGFNGRRDH